MTNLRVNEKAPLFNSIDQEGNKITSENLLGKKVALYFYPKNNTPGCTAQACNLRDNYEILKENEITIIGISADDSDSHLKFIDKLEIPFPLIPDTDHKLINRFGVWGPKKFMGKEYEGIHRTTFLLDESGLIVDIISKPKTKDHAAEILESFEKLNNN